MPERRLLFAGLGLLALALVIILVATGLRGPLNPECSGRPYAAECRQVVPMLLMWGALPVAITGALLVAIWIGRRDDAAGDEAAR